MLRKLRRSCRITPKGNPQLMIALTLMLMLGNMLAPIASTIEAASATANVSQADELASQSLQPTPTPATTTTTLLRPSTNLQVQQQLQPLQPIDREQPDDEDQTGDDQDQDEEEDVDKPTTPMEQPAGIIVNLYWCGDDVDLQNAPTNDYTMGESLKTECDVQAAPVTVRISSATNSYQPMESTVYQFPGAAEFSPLPQDTWTINVMPKVVVTQDLFNCNGLTPYGNTKPYQTYARIVQDKSQYDMDLLGEEVITCDWFGQVPDTSSLNITKWNCPEGFDFETQGYDVARQTCWDDVNPPVEFTVKNVEQNSTFEEKRATDPNNNDEVFFPEIPEGALEVTEVVPEGYGLVAVYCSVNASFANVVDLSQADMFALKANGGDAIRCDAFDTLGANPGTMGRPTDTDDDTGVSVTIYKWECPTGTDPDYQGATVDDTHEYFSGACDTQMAGVPFTINDGSLNSPIQTESDIDGQQIDGLVPIDPGYIEIIEGQVPGYLPPVAFCHELNSEQSQMMVVDRGIAIRLADGDLQIQCFFYNIPMPDTTDDGTSDVKIWKWDCGNAFTTDANADASNPEWLRTNCTTPQDATFSLNMMTSTTSGGYTEFLGVAPGTWELKETPPDGYAPVAAVCGLTSRLTDPADVVYGAAMTPSNDAVSIETLADHVVYCHWFNTPVDTGDISVTIYKWLCEPGTDATQTDQEYFGEHCATEQAGVPFDIYHGGTTVNTTSDTNGRQIDNLVPDVNGNITIVEDIPGGYSTPAVFCQFVGQDSSEKMTVDVGSVVLTVPFEDAQIQCFFYNIPGETGYGNVYVYKLACPAGAPADADLTWFTMNCQTPRNGVTFVLEISGVDIMTDTGDRGAGWEGIAAMESVETGTYPLTETSDPDGYSLLAAYCTSTDVNATPLVNNLTPMPLNGTSINVSVENGKSVHCYWYNAPSTDNTVHVTKWECPEGTAQDATIEWLQNNCMTRLAGVDFTLTTSAGATTQTTDMDGETAFAPVPAGMITLAESIPTGYSPYPIVVCGGTVYLNGAIGDMFPAFVSAPGGQWSYMLSEGQWTIHCDFYNIPETPSTVIIYKWSCPEGVTPEPTIQWHQDNCTVSMDGVDFTLTDVVGPRTLTTAGGMVTFTDVATGPIQIKETIPSGYSNQPFLVCQFMYADGSGTGQYSPTPVNGVYNTTIDQPGSEFRCDWYNHPVGPGEITVYKWTCPQGYDRTAWGADPMVDCTQATNGITFRLIQPAPMPELQSDTGDSIPGAVYFGGLEPGTYILNELLAPDQAVAMKEVFVWQCYGLTTSSVQPYPLNVGQMFQFDIVGGDNIVCHWFNVPKTPHGWMDVTKFNCTTEKYVADVYCYTNQTGQEFNLQKWDGANWNTIVSGITDVNGKLSFPNLDEGDYRLVEPGKEACLIKSSNITPNKNIGVKNGEGTTVYVYNCKTPPPPNDKPGKYPNTGVGPDAAASQESRMPGIELAGLIGLAGVSMNRRRFLKRAAGVTLGAGALARPAVAAQDLVSLDSTPAPATPGANILGCGTPTVIGPDEGTPGPGTPVWEDPCTRGAVPLRFRVPIIGVDAAVEYLEIIDGQMQPPTGAEDVTWYKETSRLGEVGNGIYAGHLNYWGIPEGVFFRLESLQEGDVIEIDGNDAKTYIYVVQWMQNFPSDDEPPEEALGKTDDKAITVITCGGEWVSARAEYDHRTLVRAVLLEDQA